MTNLHLRPFHRSFVAVAALCALVTPPAARAEDAKPGAAPVLPAPAASGAAGDQAQRVEISSGAGDERRLSTTAKIVVTRSDLDKYNDANALDVLRRVPGVSVAGSGRSTDIRVHGLGGGYVQILINGQPAPEGFTLDSVSPALIERIEVQSTPTLDQTAHGIAGTINLVMRQASSQPTRQLKASFGGHAGNPSSSVDGVYSDADGAWRYSLAGTLARERSTYPITIEQDARDAAGTDTFADHTDRVEWYVDDTLGLTPTLKWSPDPKHTLTLDSFVRERHTQAGTTDVRTLQLGTPPLYASDDLRLSMDSSLVRTKLGWHQEFEDTSSLDAKVGYTDNRRRTDSTFLEYSPQQRELLLDEHVHGLAIERAISSSGKYNLPFTSEHSIAAGWDGDFVHRGEDRVQRQSAPPGYPAVDLDEIYDIRVDRFAAYAQDEWDVSRAVSMYWGARWEGLETLVAGNELRTVDNQTGMLSPIAQFSWKVGGSSSDKFRASVARTYNVPTVRDLNPRRYVSNDNTPTTPDQQGNPELRPERSLGLDLAFEHYFGKSGGMVSVSGILRRISDVITRTTEFDGTSWVNSPSNGGDAVVEGLGVEGNLALAELDAACPAVDLRFNVNWNHSRVSGIPGPDNRLDKQTPFTLGAGFDYRLPSKAWKFGMNYSFDGGGPVTLAPGQMHDPHATRNLDAYAAWTVSPQTQLRLSGNHLVGRSAVVDDAVADGGGVFEQRAVTAVSRTWKIALEHKF